MSAPIDVLAVMARDATHAYHWRREGDDAWAEEISMDSEYARRATQEVFSGYQILLAIAKSKDDYFFDWPNGWDWERLESAIARVRGAA